MAGYTDPENPTEIQNGQPGYGVNGYNQPESYDPGDLYISEEFINSWATAIKYYLSCDSGACNTTIYDELTDDWRTFFESCDAGTVTNCDNSLQPSYATTPIPEGAPQYHLGNYYNWTAAVAKNGTSSYDTGNTDLDQSICPANWTLPKTGNNTSNGSVAYLLSQYGWSDSTYMLDGYIVTQNPLFLNLAGVWYGSLEGVGGEGFFWSPVVLSSNHAYSYGAVVDGGVNPSLVASLVLLRYAGFTVRCVAR